MTAYTGQITPMLKQYFSIKDEHKDSILFFRLGDFYEMFFDDAMVASKALDLTLTGRGKDENRVSMCGVPHHAAENYIIKLVKKGFKIAICEQVEEASESKGITRREVTRIVSPGTLMEESALEATENNFLAALSFTGSVYGLSFVDISTGEFKLAMLDSFDQVRSLLNQFDISELLINEGITEDIPSSIFTSTARFQSPEIASKGLIEQFRVPQLGQLGLESYLAVTPAAWAIIEYLLNTQQHSLSQLRPCTPYLSSEYLQIDGHSIKHLELIESNATLSKKGSLFWVLNSTKTAMGARRLSHLIKHPFLSTATINKRLDILQVFYDDLLSREEIRDSLTQIYDIERLLSRVVSNRHNPKDLLSLKQSLEAAMSLPLILDQMSFEGINDFTTMAKLLCENGSVYKEIHTLIDESILDPAPLTLRDGNVIKPGFDEQLDELLDSFKSVREWINQLEEKEQERTGIRQLKVGYNKVFGYYFQISKGFKGEVPEGYIRKQTLTNAERYINAELKEKETLLFNGEEKQIKIETDIYHSIVEHITTHVPTLQDLALWIAELDVYQSLASISQKNNYSRPQFVSSDKKVLDLKGNFHPVLKQNKQLQVIPNDISLGSDDHLFTLITGPNMAGKSTIMRQVALTVIMAQIACFVPAQEAKLSVVDKLFTRIGATDNLYAGQSTFMTEMLETANLLTHATDQSLLLLDEIGRGTSTYDGISIAGAITEFIHNTLNCRAFFATHYHELTTLEKELPHLKNMSMSITEETNRLVFTYTLIDGPADKSYGIHVAEMAGLPQPVIDRAKILLESFEQQGAMKHDQFQLSLFV